MYGYVAQRACLILLRLVVEGRRSWSAQVTRMAAQAQQVHLVLHQQTLVRRSVRRMACRAALKLRFMLVDKRPLLFRVALVANLVARSICPQLFWPECPVGVVTIVALNQSLVDAVMERPRKLGFHVHVARVAKFRRFGFHQELAFLAMMWRVAIDAGHTVRQMHGTVIVAVLLAVLVTPQTASAGFLRRNALEREYFRFVSAAIDMLFAWTVACLTTLPLRSFVGSHLGIQCGSKVRCGFKLCK